LMMLGWALIDRSIWALAAGGIFPVFVSALLSHLYLEGASNRWMWQKSSFDEVINFGKWIFLSSITGFLVNNADRFVLAGLLGATAFGVYVISFLIFSAIDQLLSKIITDIAYPALSEVARERPSAMKTNYYKFYIIIASIAYFCSGFLVKSGETLIGILYDSRYQDAGWMLQILAVALVTLPLRLASQTFFIFGEPRI